MAKRGIPRIFGEKPERTVGAVHTWESRRVFIEVYASEGGWLWIVTLRGGRSGYILLEKRAPLPLPSAGEACRSVERFINGLELAVFEAQEGAR